VTSPELTVVVGQGYVGLPLAQAMTRAGLLVRGLETRSDVVEGLNAGKSHVDDLTDAQISAMVSEGYQATSDTAIIAEARNVVICVPTPLGESGEPDLAAVRSASTAIAQHLRPGTLVILESTSYPGTTEEVVAPLLEASGLMPGVDFFLAFSPERIDPGNPTYGLTNTPKVVGGVNPESTEAAASFYGHFVDRVVRTKGTREAETAKLLENTYRHVNIALVNEMARFCADMGIDIWDVIAAASTKPFGFQAFHPGPGVGGHCIPIDPNYLSFEVRRRLGYPFRFVELAEEINHSMPNYIVGRLQDALNNMGKPLKGTTVLLLGVAYKANIADDRESPATPIATLLEAKGAIVEYHDPLIAQWTIGSTTRTRVPDLPTALETAHATVLLQAHSAYDIDSLCEASALFFDTRGVSTHPKAVRL